MSARSSAAWLAVALIASPHPVHSDEVTPLPIAGRNDSLGVAQRAASPSLASTLPTTTVAEAEASWHASMAFGDSDKDGRVEVFVATDAGGPSLQYRILEAVGDGTFTNEYTGDELLPFTLADFDGDGSAELVGQFGAYLRVYESTSPLGHPVNPTWSSGPLSNVESSATAADTDQDGALEIVYSQNFLGGSARLLIYESVANDSFALKLNMPLPGNSAVGNKAVGDFDGDGLTEVATCGVDGVINVVEATGDDTWMISWSTATGMTNAYGVQGGRDTDGNGLPELFVTGNVVEQATAHWRTLVFEPAGADSFVKVDSMSVTWPFIGATISALGDIDGLGRSEFMFWADDQIWVYWSSTPGQWDLKGAVPDPDAENGGHGQIYCVDVNQNGTEEMVWQGFPGTLFLEEATTTSTNSVGVRHMPLWPNPARDSVAFRRLVPNGTRLNASLYDARGRLLKRVDVTGSSNQIQIPLRDVPAGSYFLRLESSNGRPIGASRLSVLR